MTRKRPTSPAHMQYRTVEIRADTADLDAGLSGYASHFGSIDAYGTAVKRGAFTKTLQERGGRVPVLWNHWSDTPIGLPTELKEDDTGLWFNASIVEETQAGAEVMALLRKGVPLGMSFGFETIKSRPIEEADDLDWSHAPDFYRNPENRPDVRVIEEIRLWEISVVTFPANELATIDSVRAADQASALTTLLEDLRAGRIGDTDTRWALLHDAAAFIATQPEPVAPTTPLPTPDARQRNIDVQVALANARLAGLIAWETQR